MPFDLTIAFTNLNEKYYFIQIAGKKGILKRRKVGTVVRPDENAFVTATTPLTTTTIPAATPMSTSENISPEEDLSKSRHNLKNKTFEVQKKTDNEISATGTPTSATPATATRERRQNIQKSTNYSSNKTLETVEKQLSGTIVHFDNQLTRSHNETHQQKVEGHLKSLKQ